MRALRLDGVRSFAWTTLPDRVPGPDEVVVRPAAVAICGSDLAAYTATHPRIAAPVVLGHELAGTVVEAGSNVDPTLLGRRVAVEPTSGCGRCRTCVVGRENICPSYAVIGETADRPGGFAERVVVEAANVHPLPDDVSLEEGALAQPLAIGVHAVRNRAGVRPGQVVAVVGAGAIGLACQLASLAAGATVMTVEPRRFRSELAEKLGAMTADPRSARAQIEAMTDGAGADVVFEAAGGTSPKPIDLAMSLAARGARIVLLGTYPRPRIEADLGRVKQEELEVVGAQAHPGTFPSAVAGIADGTLPARALITHRIGLDDAPSAFALLEDQAAPTLKVVLMPDA